MPRLPVADGVAVPTSGLHFRATPAAGGVTRRRPGRSGRVIHRADQNNAVARAKQSPYSATLYINAASPSTSGSHRTTGHRAKGNKI